MIGQNKDTGRWAHKVANSDHIDYNTKSDYVHQCKAFMIDDLKFLSTMLGNDCFDIY